MSIHDFYEQDIREQYELIKDDLQLHLFNNDMLFWIGRSETELAQLLKDFGAFSIEYFSYFEKDVIRQDEHKKYGKTEEYVRYQALQTIVNEWMVLSQVAEQRGLAQYRNWLQELDQKAKDIYCPPSLQIPVVAYLGKVSSIRHNPYSDVSVCSIPRYYFKNKDEALMAYAHEIGHKVFWTLKDSGVLSGEHEELSKFVRQTCIMMADKYELTLKQFQVLNVLIDSWLEEIFADVYGAVVACLPHVKSLISILKGNFGEIYEVFGDDGDHPLPYLRPLLRIEVLELMLEEKADWQTILGDRANLPEKEELANVRAAWEKYVWNMIAGSRKLDTISLMVSKQTLIYLKSRSFSDEIANTLKNQITNHKFTTLEDFLQAVTPLVKLEDTRLGQKEEESYLDLIRKGALQIESGELSVVFVEKILYKVVKEVVLPLVKNTLQQEIALPVPAPAVRNAQPSTPFQRYLARIQARALLSAMPLCKLLLHNPISEIELDYGTNDCLCCEPCPCPR